MLISKVKVDKKQYGLSSCKADIYACLVQVDASDSIASIIEEITDHSWIRRLNIVPKISYQARLKETVESIMKDCRIFISNQPVYDYSTVGEYIVSKEGRRTLYDHFSHLAVPLAELWKEKKSGNPGFDYHSEAPTNLIIFGEAKYKAQQNPYSIAIDQVEDFISREKDARELIDLENFVSPSAVQNFVDGKKGFSIAFSIHAKNPQMILNNAIRYVNANQIANYNEYYIVGVLINDK